MKLNKNSLQIFDVLSKGWEITPLGEVLPIVYGRGLTKGKRIETGQFPVYGSSGLVGYHDVAMTQKPTLIIGRKGSVGEVYYSKTPCWPIDTVFFAEEHESLHLNYFEHLLRGINLSALDKSTAVPGLSRDDYNSVEVAIAPLNEQYRIVDKIEELFSELDKGVESLTTAREQLNVYRQSLLKQAFEGKLTELWRAEHAGQLENADQLLARIKKEREKRYQEQLAEWEKAVEAWRAEGRNGNKPSKPQKIKKIQQLSRAGIYQLPVLPDSWGWTTLGELISGKARSMQSGPFGSNLKHSEFTSQGILVIGIDNVLDGKFSLGNQNRITKKKFEELKKYQARPKDLLVTVMASLGRTCVVPENIEDAIITKHVYRITMEEKLLSTEFYNLLLQSHTVSRRRMFENAQGQTRPGLNSTILRELPVPLCDLSEQQEIFGLLNDKLVELDRVADSIESEITKTKAVRQSILKKAFSGQLVPQNPNDEPASKLLVRIKIEREAAQKEAKKHPRNVRKKKEVITMADLIEVIRAAQNWISAQDAFRQCGIADGAETDAIEKIYQQLRDYEKQGKIAVERRSEEDWLRLV
ncbi:MAG: restriction endonuclease subunit S [Proteobacteria bacterium]|nr:restriction endonuclease subunit S [Pseudomonadota bacterium]